MDYTIQSSRAIDCRLPGKSIITLIAPIDKGSFAFHTNKLTEKLAESLLMRSYSNYGCRSHFSVMRYANN